MVVGLEVRLFIEILVAKSPAEIEMSEEPSFNDFEFRYTIDCP